MWTALEHGDLSPDVVEARMRDVFARPGTFDFLMESYVWHFTNAVRTRSLVMGETWRRIRAN